MRRLGVQFAAEAEHGRRLAERLGEVRERRDPDPAAHQQRSLDVEPVAVAERAENRGPIAGLKRAERPRTGADWIDQEGELVGRRETEAHRARQRPSRRLEHEELAGDSRVEATAGDPQQRVGPDLLGAGDFSSLGLH